MVEMHLCGNKSYIERLCRLLHILRLRFGTGSCFKLKHNCRSIICQQSRQPSSLRAFSYSPPSVALPKAWALRQGRPSMGLSMQLLRLRRCHCQAMQPFFIGFQTFYVLLKARAQKDLYVTAEGFRGDSVTLPCHCQCEACFQFSTFMLSFGSHRAYSGTSSHKLAV